MRKSSLFFLASLATAGSAQAAGDPWLVVPAGSGDGLEVTASVAYEVAEHLRRKGTTNVKLAYPLDRPTYAPSRHARLAQKHLRLAKRAYKVLELESVRKHAQKALKLFKDEIKRGAKSTGYVEALHYLSAAETVNGNEKAGFKWMNDAYLFARRPPNPKIFNPQVQATYAKVAGADDHLGSLRFRVEPGALLWLNDELRGAARDTLTLRAGLYLVRIGRPGLLTYEKWLRVRLGQVREITLKLRRGPASEPEVVTRLRKELDAAPGPSTLLLATDFGAAEVLVIGAAPSCTRARCPIKLRWAKGGGGKWVQSRDITTGDTPKAIAQRLMGSGDEADGGAGKGDGAKLMPVAETPQCLDDVQCLSNQKCVSGRCESVVPITRKWWFWTIVGVVAVGAGTTAAVLLTRPENTVLEVR